MKKLDNYTKNNTNKIIEDNNIDIKTIINSIMNKIKCVFKKETK